MFIAKSLRDAPLRGLGTTLACRCWTQWCRRPALAPPRFHGQLVLFSRTVPMANWTPTAEGPLQLSPILLRSAVRTRWVSALAHRWPARVGDLAGSTRCPAVFLNGVHPKRTDGADIQAGVTIDQMAAAKIGQDTLLPSLELAIEDYSGLVGSCDVGFSCTYMNTISWRTPTTPMPMEINPRVIFDRMFGDGATAEE